MIRATRTGRPISLYQMADQVGHDGRSVSVIPGLTGNLYSTSKENS